MISFKSGITGCCYCCDACGSVMILFSIYHMFQNFLLTDQYENLAISLTHYFIFLFIVFSNYVTDFFVKSFNCQVEKVYDWLFVNLQSILNWFMKGQDILWHVEILWWTVQILLWMVEICYNRSRLCYEQSRFWFWHVEILL